MKALDTTDRRLLALLQRDATLSLQEIADQVGLSVNPCWRRIKRMEAEAIIRARVTLVDPDKIGLHVTAFICIKIREHTEQWVATFDAVVQETPEIVECHRIGGDIDYLLKIVVPDIAAYDRVYRHLILRVPALIDVSALFSMERIKNTTVLTPPAMSKL